MGIMEIFVTRPVCLGRSFNMAQVADVLNRTEVSCLKRSD